MNRLFTVLIGLFAFFLLHFNCYSQSSTTLVLDEASLVLINVDEITGLALDPIAYDRSNRPCARIKLHINRMTPEDIRKVEVRTIGGNIVVMKQYVAQEGNGLIIELTARPETRFYIHHDSLGDSNAVNLCLDGGKEYLMEAWSSHKLPITVFYPKTASEVYLDDVFRGHIEADNHITIIDVSPGSHTLRVTSGQDDEVHHIEVSSENAFFNLQLTNQTNITDTTPAADRSDNTVIHTDVVKYSFIVAVRSNLLYDALQMPNIGLEINLANKWSLLAEYMHMNLNMSTEKISATYVNSHILELNGYGGLLRVRRYFGKTASKHQLAGHHLGIYGQLISYDCILGKLRVVSDVQHPIYGIDYGYSFPINRRLNIDVEAGVGYLHGKHYEYTVENNNYEWRGTVLVDRAIPKVSVSLVWQMFKKRPYSTSSNSEE